MNPINPADDDMTAPIYETAPTYEPAIPIVSRAVRLGAPIHAPDDDRTAPTYERTPLVVNRAARLGARIAPLASTASRIAPLATRGAPLGIANGANQRAARLGIGSALGSRAARLGLVADPVDPGDQEQSA